MTTNALQVELEFSDSDDFAESHGASNRKPISTSSSNSDQEGAPWKRREVDFDDELQNWQSKITGKSGSAINLPDQWICSDEMKQAVVALLTELHKLHGVFTFGDSKNIESAEAMFPEEDAERIDKSIVHALTLSKDIATVAQKHILVSKSRQDILERACKLLSVRAEASERKENEMRSQLRDMKTQLEQVLQQVDSLKKLQSLTYKETTSRQDELESEVAELALAVIKTSKETKGQDDVKKS
ncbi:hypothetical protein HDU76_005799 [Blyttiomyces sp. JEL0837]|nr:hypothetical protein HDU76_005799 [Blyttiomyces sp. JEL0837]